MTHWIQRKPHSPGLCPSLPMTRLSAFLHHLPSTKASATKAYSFFSDVASASSTPSERTRVLTYESESTKDHSRPCSPSSSRNGLTDCDEDSELDDSDWEDEGHAQYITIPPDSPYWKAPRKPFTSFLSPPSTTSSYKQPTPSSSSLATRILEQTALLQLFHAELRRMIPSDGSDTEISTSSFEFDECLKHMDAELLLAPSDAFEGVCMELEIESDVDLNWDVPGYAWSPWSDDSSHRFPDVPLDLEESDDESFDGWIMERPS